MSEGLGHKAVKGTVWASIDKFGVMGLQFIVNLVMARLLTPVDYGIVAVLSIFFAVSQVFIDGGFGSALIQKKSPTQSHYSTIFWWNLFVSILIYVILYVCSGLIADFFKMPILKDIVKVLSLVLPFNALSIVQVNKIRKELALNKLAITSITTYLISGSLGIYCVYNGYGVWSLVVSQVSYSLFLSIIMVIITKWVPSLVFSIKYFKELFGFGIYIFLANILQEICRNFQSIIIGRRFNVTDMGYYSQAQKLESISSTSLAGVIMQVMYPVYSTVQDDDMKLREILQINIRVITFLVFPVLGFLIMCAEYVITGLYGYQWQPSAPLFQILCIGGLFTCLQTVNYYAVAAKGKSKQLFYWSFYKWGMLLALLLGGMFFGMKGLMWSMVISNLNIWLVNAFLVQKYVGLKVWHQISSIMPMMATMIICFVAAQFLVYISINIWIAGCALILLSYGIPFLMRLKCAEETWSLINKLIVR